MIFKHINDVAVGDVLSAGVVVAKYDNVLLLDTHKLYIAGEQVLVLGKADAKEAEVITPQHGLNTYRSEFEQRIDYYTAHADWSGLCLYLKTRRACLYSSVTTQSES